MARHLFFYHTYSRKLLIFITLKSISRLQISHTCNSLIINTMKKSYNLPFQITNNQ